MAFALGMALGIVFGVWLSVVAAFLIAAWIDQLPATE